VTIFNISTEINVNGWDFRGFLQSFQVKIRDRRACMLIIVSILWNPRSWIPIKEYLHIYTKTQAMYKKLPRTFLLTLFLYFWLHNLLTFFNNNIFPCPCQVDRLCGLVVTVLGYRSGGPSSIHYQKKKLWVWNGVHSASWVQLRSCLIEK
jgi:hypothetical protein